jgi:hypothetical protein
MDKSPFQNEEVAPQESNPHESNNEVVIETQPIDVLSIPQKKDVLDEDKDKNSPVVDEQSLDDNWLLLSQDWQTQPFEKTDIQAQVKQTKNRTFLAKSLLVLDVIATLGIFIALLVGLYQGDWGVATISYLLFGFITSVIFVYYEIKIRLRIWQHSCDSPDKAVENAILGVESSIKYTKLIKLSCWVLLPVANWYVYVMIQESEKSPWPPFLVMNSFIIVMWFITHWFYLKRKKELKQFSVR